MPLKYVSDYSLIKLTLVDPLYRQASLREAQYLMLPENARYTRSAYDGVRALQE